MTYYIINNKNQKIHREPGRASWETNRYATPGAAKAGITRTIKYYQKAIDEVAETVAQGKPEFYARMYNAYRDATDPALGRTDCAKRETYSVVAVRDYVEPQVTRTGIAPGTGKQITVTMGINEVGGCCDPLTETYWSM